MARNTMNISRLGMKIHRFFWGSALGVVLASTATSARGQAYSTPLIMDWSEGRYLSGTGAAVVDTALPGYDPVPFLWKWDPLVGYPPVPSGSVQLGTGMQGAFAWQQSNSYASFHINEYDAPVNGTYDPSALGHTLDWFHSKGYRLDYVTGDIEWNGDITKAYQDVGAIVDQVRNYKDSRLNVARVGAYSFHPGLYNYAAAWPQNITTEGITDSYYRALGLTLAMPSSYVYSSDSIHADGNTWLAGHWTDPATGLPSTRSLNAPNQRSAFFWAPLERFSNSARGMVGPLTGNQLLPFVSGMQYNPSYPIALNQDPTENDYQATIEHMRLRGAVGVYTFDGGIANGHGIDYTVYRNDVLSAWHSLDWFFNLPGNSTVLNLATNPSGGVEWSGMQRGNRIVAVVSNLSNSDQAASWGTAFTNINANLPSASPMIPKGNHGNLQYLSNPTVETFQSYANNSTMQTNGWHGPNPDQFKVQTSTGAGNTSTLSLGVNSGSVSQTWVKSANPGGIQANDIMVYSVKMYFGGSPTAKAAFAPVFVDNTDNVNTGVVPVHEGPEFGFADNNMQLKPGTSSSRTFQATNLGVSKNTWYAVYLLIAPRSNTGSVLVENLTAGDTKWTQLLFDDLSTPKPESLAWVPLALTDTATTTTFNGWQLTGVSGAQFDDLSMQLYPYLSTTYDLGWASAPIPEPAELGLLMLGGLVFGRRRNCV